MLSLCHGRGSFKRYQRGLRDPRHDVTTATGAPEGKGYSLLCVRYWASVFHLVVALVSFSRSRVTGNGSAVRQVMFSLGDFVVLKGFWSKLAPGGVITVWSGDDSAWHHRLMLVPARSGRYAILTSGRRLSCESAWRRRCE